MNGEFPQALFAGRRYAVLGLGRSGAGTARRLAAMGAAVTAWDDDADARSRAEHVQVSPLEDAAGFDALVLSPGIAHRLPAPHPFAARAIAAGVPVLCDAELLFQAVRRSGSRARFAGITGTNGKSTTTALLSHLLDSAGIANVAGGNLGPGCLSLPRLGDDGVYVLEMSSYMLERVTHLRFDAACLLNLSPDHLDRHGSLEAYGAVKLAIFERQQAGDLAVLGADDDWSRAQAAALRQRPAGLVTITGEHPPGTQQPGTLAPALPGAHNAQNAAAATAMARHLGASEAAIVLGLASFPGLAHRQRRIGEVCGIGFIDDSKATNADSAARALGCYDRLIWIAGGVAKSGGIEALAPLFGRVAEALLIGRDAPVLAATLAGHGVPHRTLGDLERAVPAALASAKRHAAPVVLLSPACASFDQFANFEARGIRFAGLVQEMAGAERRAH